MDSIPMGIWLESNFLTKYGSKLVNGKTYFLETNNDGTLGIPIGIRNLNHKIETVISHDNVIRSFSSFRKAYMKQDTNITSLCTGSIDFILWPHCCTIMNVHFTKNANFIHNKFDIMNGHYVGPQYISHFYHFDYKNYSFPFYVLNSNLVRFNEYIVSIADIKDFLSKMISNEFYDGYLIDVQIGSRYQVDIFFDPYCSIDNIRQIQKMRSNRKIGKNEQNENRDKNMDKNMNKNNDKRDRRRRSKRQNNTDIITDQLQAQGHNGKRQRNKIENNDNLVKEISKGTISAIEKSIEDSQAFVDSVNTDLNFDFNFSQNAQMEDGGRNSVDLENISNYSVHSNNSDSHDNGSKSTVIIKNSNMNEDSNPKNNNNNPKNNNNNNPKNGSPNKDTQDDEEKDSQYNTQEDESQISDRDSITTDENENVISDDDVEEDDSIDLRDFSRISNSQRLKMIELAIESYFDRDNSHLHAFEKIEKFSRKDKVYDNASNTDYYKEKDYRFQQKDIVTTVARASRTEDDSYIRIRFSSDCFKKGTNAWKFMVKFADFKREVIELSPNGIFNQIEDKDFARQKYYENEVEHSQKILDEIYNKQEMIYNVQMIKYREEKDEYDTQYPPEDNNNNSNSNNNVWVKRARKNRRRPPPPTKPVKPIKKNIDDMSYQEKMNDETNCKFRIYYDDDEIGGYAIVQHGKIQFKMDLIERDCMEICIHPDAKFTRLKNWQTRVLLDVNKWKRSKEYEAMYSRKYDFPTDTTVEIVEPSNTYKYRVNVSIDEMNDNDNQWVIRDNAIFYMEKQNKVIEYKVSKLQEILNTDYVTLREVDGNTLLEAKRQFDDMMKDGNVQQIEIENKDENIKKKDDIQYKNGNEKKNASENEDVNVIVDEKVNEKVNEGE